MKLLFKTPSLPIHPVSEMNRDVVVESLSKFERNWVHDVGFHAKLGETVLIPEEDGALGRVLFGLGDFKQQSRSRLYFGDLPKTLPPWNYHFVETDEFDIELATLSWLMGCYRFAIEPQNTREVPRLVASDRVNAPQIEMIANACALTQDLINTPANLLDPDELAGRCKSFARDHACEFTEIRGDALLQNNFPLIHAVGRASAHEPRLVELNWGKSEHPKLAIIGKGICFDTGGLDLKPSSSMGLMKKDMGGAAHALGLAQMIIKSELPVNLRVLIPIAENSVSANAFRPGDVLRARNGQTVEVNNTDAEGRLVLADALAYAKEQNPELAISLATLTGAARVAVGPDLAPYYSDNAEFNSAVECSAKALQDPVWRMPFWDPYDELIEPGIADLDNAPSGGMAGSITAALFLRRFADAKRYAHFDIYAWNPSAKPARPKGGASQAIRAIFGALSERYSSEE